MFLNLQSKFDTHTPVLREVSKGELSSENPKVMMSAFPFKISLIAHVCG